MGAIFGGSKSKQNSSQQSSSESYGSSSSWNNAFNRIAQLYGGEAADSGIAAGRMVSDALMGGKGAADAFGGYKKSIGYDQLMKDAMGAVSGKFGALGLGNSGAAAREAQRTATGLGQQAYSSWLDKLFGVQDRAQAGTAQMVQAGNRSESQQMSKAQSTGTSSGSSKSKNGIGGFLGGILSDRRLKKDITKVGELDNGLGLYKFTYTNGHGPFIGVMAQEVAEIAPEALGPTTRDGYMTVNYNKLGIQMVSA